MPLDRILEAQTKSEKAGENPGIFFPFFKRDLARAFLRILIICLETKKKFGLERKVFHFISSYRAL